ncbi:MULTISPECIES: prolipoprotein diacylglyceryl transferase [Prosthecochloris]|uniref:Phosphatidylglycerol--prolipoprotein diacylglyceryl transferase n=1 Tax=Prosthecochloris marina TaxID=2017681 RepID=A0A317T945_9CHLB|nr:MULTISPECIES: prolipoprotein diacylglyceryl transferase [Prosthecochloris]PWW83095.1 prolipoprotein diacylglyceryl transferase [Prosthecochloris marina]UZJ38700.1 prolipoprotein diacylglyceryl transferase [Prosthecochloris sp. SCSIO W1103]
MDNFIFWWQTLPSRMDPVIFTVGNFPVRWYGMMYIIAFGTVYLLTQYRIKSENLSYSPAFAGDVLTWAIVGVLLGGRLGYLLFYSFPEFIANPLGSIIPFSLSGGSCSFSGIAGMSYHGGAIGVIIAVWLFTKNQKKPFLTTIDLFIVSLPLGYTFGRLGNFINGELYGRVTDAAIGMHFPMAPGNELRHPSQLYEAFFEGIFLFIILWTLRKKAPYPGFLSGLYLFGYGFVRFFIEFYREPDAHLGFVFMQFSMGQLLCLAMIAGGIGVMILCKGLGGKVASSQ